MASQVLSGAVNASYTNNTGQNVRLIINYMSNVTSMTWAGVTVTASSTTIGKDIQNITGELRQAVKGSVLSTDNGGNTLYDATVWAAEIAQKKASLGYYRYNSGGAGTEGFQPTPTPPRYTAPTGFPSSGADAIAQAAGDFQPEQATNSFYAHEDAGINDTGTQVVSPNLFYVPLTISRGGNFPVELMLANGQAFSAVCGAFNAVIIKEDGT